MITWSSFREIMDLTSISTKFGPKTRRSSNHQVARDELVFKLSVLRVSHENRIPELSGDEVEGQGLASLVKGNLATRVSKHFSSRLRELAAESKSWHCFKAIKSSDHVQYLISSNDFSDFSNKLCVPVTELFISMNCAAQYRREILEGVMSVLPWL